MKRPFGLTSLAVLAIVAGVAEMLVSFAAFAHLGLFGSGAASLVAGAVSLSGSQDLALGLSVVLFILACLYIVFAIGTFGMRAWAWGLGVALAILTVLNTGVSAAVAGRLTAGDGFTVIVAILVLVYLYSARVRAAFGRK